MKSLKCDFRADFNQKLLISILSTQQHPNKGWETPTIILNPPPPRHPGFSKLPKNSSFDLSFIKVHSFLKWTLFVCYCAKIHIFQAISKITKFFDDFLQMIGKGNI